jgi:hypothetical protein
VLSCAVGFAAKGTDMHPAAVVQAMWATILGVPLPADGLAGVQLENQLETDVLLDENIAARDDLTGFAGHFIVVQLGTTATKNACVWAVVSRGMLPKRPAQGFLHLGTAAVMMTFVIVITAVFGGPIVISAHCYFSGTNQS